MIPLVVCRVDDPANVRMAGAMAVAALLFGFAAMLLPRPASLRIRGGATFLAGCSVPATGLIGIWPFDPAWRDDCGFTPDPNLWVEGVSLAFPVLAVVGFVAALFWRRR